MTNPVLKILADVFRPKEHDIIINKIDKLDKQQGEISTELQHIREHLDPLYKMVMELREPPEGWDVRRRQRRR